MLSDDCYIMHLTPCGWVEGTEITSRLTITRTVPDDTVPTLTFHETVYGILKQAERKVDVNYLVECSTDMLKILFSTYGKLPERFSSWNVKVDW